MQLLKGQFKDEFVTAGGVPLSEVAHSLTHSLSLFLSVHWVCNYFCCFYEDLTEHNGKQNAVKFVLRRGGSDTLKSLTLLTL